MRVWADALCPHCGRRHRPQLELDRRYPAVRLYLLIACRHCADRKKPIKEPRYGR